MLFIYSDDKNSIDYLKSHQAAMCPYIYIYFEIRLFDWLIGLIVFDSQSPYTTTPNHVDIWLEKMTLNQFVIGVF